MGVKLLAVVAIVAALLMCSASAQYTRGWIDLFQPPYSQCPTIMMAISCVSHDLCYIPGGQNGQGFTVYSFSGDVNGNFVPLHETKMEMMSMACSMGGSSADNAKGCIGGFGLGNGVEYLVNKTTFSPSQGPLFVTTQDIRATKKDGKNVMVIDQMDSNGGKPLVLFSTDFGKNFNSFSINSKYPTNTTMNRYGAVVDDKTWFVSAGNWPSHHKAGKNERIVSERVSYVTNPATGKVKRQSKNVLKSVQAPSHASGYSAAIMSTTDGGQTWSTLFSSATDFYFNGIDCHSATLCIAVGEGFDANAAGHVYLSTDGKTFTEVLKLVSNNTAAYSLMAVKFLSATEAWIGGSAQTQSGSEAVFLFTKDGGKTWARHGQLPNIGDIADISFTSDGVGFATAVTIYDDSTVLRYDNNGPTPTPAPTWAGNFTQKQYNDSSCTGAHTTLSLPQNTCLKLNGGGSAKAQCQAGVLMQDIYPLSDTCTGPAEQQPQPLNQCLKTQGGQSFENFCGPAVAGERVSMEKAKPMLARRQ